MSEYSHQEEKWLKEARQRDRFRDKISQGKRWRAEEDADHLLAETMKIKEKSDIELDRKQRPEGRDNAMNTVLQELHRDK